MNKLMNVKVGIIIGVVIAVLILGIGGYMLVNSAKKAIAPQMGQEKQEGSSMFASIKDALSKNLSLQCNIDNLEGHKTVTYIKNGKIRADVTGSTVDESGSIIMRDSKMYFWNNKGGYVMEFNIDEMQKAVPTGTVMGQNPSDYMDMMEKYKEQCKPATIADSLFEVPTNIKFQDMSDLMKMAVPSGVSGMPQVNPTNYQELMQQYQQGR